MCAVLLVELMAEAGFPAGSVNLVTGAGADVGDAIIDSPDVPVISFTGSSATGRRIAERAGRRLKRLSLELGGKNGIVVMADADLDLATDGILWSAFGTTGQRCTAASRVVVERAVVEPLVQRLEARARKLRLGPGADPGTDVGPLINAGAVEKVAGYVEIGRGEGELVTGGSRATDEALANGHFFEPTIFNGVAPMDRIAQEEIFGPVLSVVPVDDYQGAVTAINQTRYGLIVVDLHARRQHGVPGDARLRDRDRLRQRRHDRRGDPSPVRRLEGNRQRPPRGRPRCARHVHGMEVHLRRLQRPAAAGPDRQPVTAPARPEVKIRPVTVDDLEVLIGIYLDTAVHHAAIDPEVFHVPARDAVAVRLRRRIEGRGVTGEYVAAVIGDEMVGSASVDIADPPAAGNMVRAVPTAEFGVSVVESWRGHGIGRALIDISSAGPPTRHRADDPERQRGERGRDPAVPRPRLPRLRPGDAEAADQDVTSPPVTIGRRGRPTSKRSSSSTGRAPSTTPTSTPSSIGSRSAPR